VGQLVHQGDLRAAQQDRVKVHLGQSVAAIVDLPAGNDLQPGDQGVGLMATMGLDDADHDVGAIAAPGLCGREHLVGLADAWSRAKKDLQPSALGARGCAEQGFGGGTAVIH
jgi:hypothetical protein